jgi:hypothetical protein
MSAQLNGSTCAGFILLLTFTMATNWLLQGLWPAVAAPAEEHLRFFGLSIKLKFFCVNCVAISILRDTHAPAFI